MAKYSDSALRGWKRSGSIRKPGAKEASPARTLSEGLQERGAGSLLLERRETGTVEVYFGWRAGGSQKRIKLGALFDIAPDGSERGISYWRAEAERVSAEVREHGGLQERAHYQAQAVAAAAQRAAEEAARGTFRHLFEDYVADRRGKVREDQIAEFERILKVDLGRFPQLLKVPAKDIGPQHIRQVLEPIWERNARRQAAKVRSFLRAAFAYGLRAEHALGRASGKSFGLLQNPVDAVSVPDDSRPGTRALTEEELAHFWQTVETADGVGPVVARLLKFIVATAGQRVEQVMREPWSSFDEDARTMRLIDAKGRGGVRRTHLVPLTDAAMKILKEVREINPSSNWPWSTTGKTPISVTTPVHAIAKWRQTNGVLDGKDVEHFTPRDLRRTCAQVMQRAGVDDRASDLLQSHGVSGVVAAHYRNDPAGYLPAKRAALEVFDAELQRILTARTA
ncbi:tyrosine-type recombinase/integrase [Pseudomonas fluorescens]|uniref:tyrosine-type recombinase/integrase n=1 Tax=Pseudomonas fluorescens TaxID=294 RepID=UPI0020C3D132|nr:site-specific integrase [Pseudomonas fluorescens]UTL90716.1 tyrosine-type recombinase/integrase [Pseudomonas fluorescens]